jgi:hypothetical protein
MRAHENCFSRCFWGDDIVLNLHGVLAGDQRETAFLLLLLRDLIHFNALLAAVLVVSGERGEHVVVSLERVFKGCVWHSRPQLRSASRGEGGACDDPSISCLLPFLS